MVAVPRGECPAAPAVCRLPSAVCLGGSRHHSALLLVPSEGREQKLYRVPGHSVLVGKEGRDEKGRGTELTLLKNISELRYKWGPLRGARKQIRHPVKLQTSGARVW